MPGDPTSVILGVIIGVVGTAVAVFFTGFGSAAGADAWAWVKDKLNPPPAPPEPPPPPLYVNAGFGNHQGIFDLNRELIRKGFQSSWVLDYQHETQRQKGYRIQHFQGHEVRPRTGREESIWMVKPPDSTEGAA